MARRGKTKPYAVYYKDGSYLIYDLTKKDYEELKRALLYLPNPELEYRRLDTVELSIGILKLEDIRAVILQRPVQMNEAANPPMPVQDQVWIKRMMRGEFDGNEEAV